MEGKKDIQECYKSVLFLDHGYQMLHLGFCCCGGGGAVRVGLGCSNHGGGGLRISCAILAAVRRMAEGRGW